MTYTLPDQSVDQDPFEAGHDAHEPEWIDGAASEPAYAAHGVDPIPAGPPAVTGALVSLSLIHI